MRQNREIISSTAGIGKALIVQCLSAGDLPRDGCHASRPRHWAGWGTTEIRMATRAIPLRRPVLKPYTAYEAPAVCPRYNAISSVRCLRRQFMISVVGPLGCGPRVI